MADFERALNTVRPRSLGRRGVASNVLQHMLGILARVSTRLGLARNASQKDSHLSASMQCHDVGGGDNLVWRSGGDRYGDGLHYLPFLGAELHYSLRIRTFIPPSSTTPSFPTFTHPAIFPSIPGTPTLTSSSTSYVRTSNSTSAYS